MNKEMAYQSKLTTWDQQADLKISKDDQTYDLCSTVEEKSVVLCNVVINGERVTGYKTEATSGDRWHAAEIIFNVLHCDHPPSFLTADKITEIAHRNAIYQQGIA